MTTRASSRPSFETELTHMSEQPELTGNQPDAPVENHQGAPDKKKTEENLTLGQELYQTLQSLVWIILVIIILFTCVARVTVVSGPSMENTLHGGDVVVTWSLGYTPKQGDIVVLTKTSFQEESIIKRVIATGGQTVDIDYEESVVYVDGVALDEPYILEEMYWPSSSYMQETHFEVPEGSVFLMGDNRNGSTDSRCELVGTVNNSYLLGKAVFAFFPFSRFGFL
jgi:signal peptidase I